MPQLLTKKDNTACEVASRGSLAVEDDYEQSLYIEHALVLLPLSFLPTITFHYTTYVQIHQPFFRSTLKSTLTMRFSTIIAAALTFATLSLSAPLIKRSDTTDQSNLLLAPPVNFTATVGEPLDFVYEYFSNTNPNYNSSNCRSIDIQLWGRSPYVDGYFANEYLPYELAVGVLPVDGWFNLTFTLPQLWTPTSDDSFQLFIIEHRYEGYSSGVADITSPFTMQNQTFYLTGASSS